MDWANLHVFLTVSREGSLAGAARALGVNHATVSRRLAVLEEEAGTRLVRRLARSTPLTERGREIAALAQEMEDRAKKIERMTKLRRGAVNGTVRLSAPPALLSETLMPVLSGVCAAHPGLLLDLVADTRIRSLEQGDADIAVRLSEPVEQQSIIRKLGQISYALYGTKQYLNQPEEAWRFIGADRALAHTPAQKWLVDFAAGRPFVLVSNDFNVQKSAAEAGLGIAVLPKQIAHHSDTLTRVDAPAPPDRTAWLVLHRDVKDEPAVRIVVDVISSLFVSREGRLD